MFISNQAIILLAALCSHLIGSANLSCKNRIEKCAHDRVEKERKIEDLQYKTYYKCLNKISWHPPIVIDLLDKDLEQCSVRFLKPNKNALDLYESSEDLYRECDEDKK